MEFFEADLTGVRDLNGAGKVRVYVTPQARRHVEQITPEPEKWLDRCFWRFVVLRFEAGLVKGDFVEFTMDADEVTQLVADLQEIDLKK
jgi:hypothetical protein